MKIVCKDNYARESIADTLICENINEYWGNRIVAALNYRHVNSYTEEYFECVEDDYVLWRGMEELI